MRTQRWPRPTDEAARLAALHELGVLDGPADRDLEALARVASYVCGTPTAAVNLIDEDRQWQIASHGAERHEVPRDDSMCAWSILRPGVTVTPDASRDPVFADNPFVTGRLASVRLYASAPVVVDTGHVVGTLCAYDDRPGELSSAQVARMADLASTAARVLELRRTAGVLARAATSDPLTGLANRALFLEMLRERLAGPDAAGTGVLYLDLDGFKPVNDAHGHHAGDAVLCEVAGRLLDCVPGGTGSAASGPAAFGPAAFGPAAFGSDAVVARLGGDEFAVLVRAGRHALLPRLEDARRRVVEALDQPLTLPSGAGRVRVGASIGMALAAPGDTADALVARADADMYLAKGAKGPGKGLPAQEAGRGR